MNRRILIVKQLTLFIAVIALLPVGANEEDDAFSFSADSTSVNFSEGREFTRLEGNAYLESGSITLRANTIELYGDDFRFVECSGNVSFTDNKQGLYLQSVSLFFDRRTEKAEARGAVVLEDRTNELVSRAAFVDVGSGGDFIILKLGVRIFKTDLQVHAEIVQYHREENTLDLLGFPRVYWKGDDYEAQRMFLNLSTDDIVLEGSVEGNISSRSSPEDSLPTESQEEQRGQEEVLFP